MPRSPASPGSRRPSRGFRAAHWAGTAFGLGWSAVVIVPLLLLVVYSFVKVRGFRVDWTFTFDDWTAFSISGRWTVALRTLRIALTITVIELVVALPFAFWLSKRCRSPRVKATFLALCTVPFFLDLASRTVVWRSILATHGPLNGLLMQLGIISAPLEWLLFSEFAVHFGMLGPCFPTMMLPIFISLQLVDDEYIQASHDLGANTLKTAWLIVLPLAMPGIVAGIVFTMVPAMADYVVPDLLGGFKVILLSTSVESALSAMQYPIAAALSTVVLAILGAFLAILVLILRRAGLSGAVFAALRR
jgi:ABC-type spermidine/putrescine transport system permease subunit I